MQFKLEKKHIPNILTISRMVLVPLIIALVLVPCNHVLYSWHSISLGINCKFTVTYFLAGLFFTIACVSDLLDGFLARKFNWVSEFGKLWDPIADKVLINSLLICFAYLGLVPVWIVVIMVARDVIVDALRIYAIQTNKDVVPANLLGKLKTVTQMAAIFVIFFFIRVVGNGQDFWGLGYWLIQNLLMYVALFFSVLSGTFYTIKILTKKI